MKIFSVGADFYAESNQGDQNADIDNFVPLVGIVRQF